MAAAAAGRTALSYQRISVNFNKPILTKTIPQHSRHSLLRRGLLFWTLALDFLFICEFSKLRIFNRVPFAGRANGRPAVPLHHIEMITLLHKLAWPGDLNLII